MSRTFCPQEWMLDLMMRGWLDPNGILLSSLERAKRAVINMKKISIIFQPSPTLIFWGAMWENLYPSPGCPGPISIPFKKKVWGHITSPHKYLGKKKTKHRPQFLRGLTSQTRSHQNLFPVPVGGEFFPLPTTSVLCHWRMGPSLPGRKKSGSVRAMTTVASVMSSGSWNSNGIKWEMIDSLAGPKYVHVNVFVCVCVCT